MKALAKTKWISIRKTNDWGRVIYTTEDGKFITFPHTRVRVRWPDGSVTRETLESRVNTDNITDHTYEALVTSDVYYITGTIRGAKTEVPIEQVEVARDCIKIPRM